MGVVHFCHREIVGSWRCDFFTQGRFHTAEAADKVDHLSQIWLLDRLWSWMMLVGGDIDLAVDGEPTGLGSQVMEGG